MAKRALITGASRGIGQAVAFEFARAGYDLVLVARDTSALNRIKNEIQSQSGVEVEVITCNLANSADRSNLNFAKIDVLINNAGRGIFGEFVSQEIRDLTETISLNCIALTELCLTATKQWKNSKIPGTIINISSLASFIPGPYFAVYAATKAFVTSFSESLSVELKEHNIKVVALCPGGVDTTFINAAGLPDKIINDQKMFLLSPKQVAVSTLRTATGKYNRQVIGWPNKIVWFLSTVLPRRLMAKMVANFYRGYVTS